MEYSERIHVMSAIDHFKSAILLAIMAFYLPLAAAVSTTISEPKDDVEYRVYAGASIQLSGSSNGEDLGKSVWLVYSDNYDLKSTNSSGWDCIHNKDTIFSVPYYWTHGAAIFDNGWHNEEPRNCQVPVTWLQAQTYWYYTTQPYLQDRVVITDDAEWEWVSGYEDGKILNDLYTLNVGKTGETLPQDRSVTKIFLDGSIRKPDPSKGERSVPSRTQDLTWDVGKIYWLRFAIQQGAGHSNDYVERRLKYMGAASLKGASATNPDYGDSVDFNFSPSDDGFELKAEDCVVNAATANGEKARIMGKGIVAGALHLVSAPVQIPTTVSVKVDCKVKWAEHTFGPDRIQGTIDNIILPVEGSGAKSAEPQVDNAAWHVPLHTSSQPITFTATAYAGDRRSVQEIQVFLTTNGATDRKLDWKIDGEGELSNVMAHIKASVPTEISAKDILKAKIKLMNTLGLISKPVSPIATWSDYFSTYFENGNHGSIDIMASKSSDTATLRIVNKHDYGEKVCFNATVRDKNIKFDTLSRFGGFNIELSPRGDVISGCGVVNNYIELPLSYKFEVGVTEKIEVSVEPEDNSGTHFPKKSAVKASLILEKKND